MPSKSRDRSAESREGAASPVKAAPPPGPPRNAAQGVPIPPTQQFYQGQFLIYQIKSASHEAAAELFDNKQMIVFTIPLLLLQLANSLIPALLISIPKTSSLVTTIISSVSTCLLALEQKLDYGGTAATYTDASM